MDNERYFRFWKRKRNICLFLSVCNSIVTILQQLINQPEHLKVIHLFVTIRKRQSVMLYAINQFDKRTLYKKWGAIFWYLYDYLICWTIDLIQSIYQYKLWYLINHRVLLFFSIAIHWIINIFWTPLNWNYWSNIW